MHWLSGETDQTNENDVRFGDARGGVIFDEEAQEPRFIFSDGNEPTTQTTPRAAAEEQATLRFLPDQVRSPFFYYVFYTNVFPGFVYIRLIQMVDSTPYFIHSVFYT